MPRAQAKATKKTRSETKHQLPNKNSTSQQLIKFIKKHIADRQGMLETMAAVGRRSALALFLAGLGFYLLREKLKPSSAWEQTLTDNKIAKTTAYEAILLYTLATKKWGAGAEAEIAKHTITEAKVELGVVRRKGEKPRPNRNRDSAHPANPVLNTRADIFLAVIAKKLEEVVNWDCDDLDQQHLDKLARHCAKLLSHFFAKKTAPSKKTIAKRRATNVA
jgi:hypothetical protein